MERASSVEAIDADLNERPIAHSPSVLGDLIGEMRFTCIVEAVERD